MENSFFEFRNSTNSKSDSDCEIEPSFIDEESFRELKTPKSKNKTLAYVAETDESSEEEDDKAKLADAKDVSIFKHNILPKEVKESSSNEVSVCKGSYKSDGCISKESSDEDAYSPEMVPNWKRRVKRDITKTGDLNDSLKVGRKNKKYMVLHDSDSESVDADDKDSNNAIIENKNLQYFKRRSKAETNRSSYSKTNLNIGSKIKNSNMVQNCDSESVLIDDSDTNDETNEKNDHQNDNSDDGEDEDHMLVSAATRMTITGVIPKHLGSDESDFIQSDESDSSKPSSVAGSLNSLSDLPDVGINKTKVASPKKVELRVYDDNDTSMISCSSIESSHDMSQDLVQGVDLDDKDVSMRAPEECNVMDNVNTQMDDEVTIIDTQPEVIAISSSDEDEPKPKPKSKNIMPKSPKPKSPKPKPKSPNNSIKKSPKPKQPLNDVTNVTQETTAQYLVPDSYPNKNVVYVKKHVRDNELNKLETLRVDLHSVGNLIKSLALDTLPDHGVKIMERLTTLEAEVKKQSEKVAAMVVEPDIPTAKDIAKDGFNNEADKSFSWDEIQAASDKVQPKMFGQQAMATHAAERHMILNRLSDLYSSLQSRPPESERAAQPGALSTSLMPYQLHALAWLQWRETQHPRGGILADDMGLGKTISMIALIVTSKDKLEEDDDSDGHPWRGKENSKLARGGTLVVCPASLLQQWSAEIKKHCKAYILSVCLHHGASRATHPHRLQGYDVVITTYNILQRDLEKRGVLMKMRWRRVILDEAHIVRNHKSLTSMAVSALESDTRWCLTGTPVQNKDLDVFALLKFLRCTPFDDLVMWKKWIDNKSGGGQTRLSMIMASLLLRRTKLQLQQKGQLDCLPQRELENIDVTLSKEEMNVYQKVLVFSKTLFAQFLHQRAEKQAEMAGGFLTKEKNDDAYRKMHKRMVALHGAKPVKSHEILVLLLRLRQVCCHCGLISAMLADEDADDVTEDAGSLDLLSELKKLTLEGEQRERQEVSDDENDAPDEGTTVSEAIKSVMSPSNPVFQLSTPSSKIKAVIKCLQQNVFTKKGEKAVVVSQWTAVLKLVEKELDALQIRSNSLTGQVPVAARSAIVDAFNDPHSKVQVMLLSLCAGGVGLNLCGGNHLLLIDPHWNPQLEEQAQDRIYRVGQKRDVHIYRFMCLDTVEQSIRKLQLLKLDLAESVLTGAKSTNKSKLSIEDLKTLFNM